MINIYPSVTGHKIINAKGGITKRKKELENSSEIITENRNENPSENEKQNWKVFRN